MTQVQIGQPPAATAPGRRALHTPLADFLLLGGATLIILPLAAAIPEAYAPQITMALFGLSFVINYPHFVHSYQIFYRDFANKLKGNGYPQHLRLRYGFAGIVVPLIILAVFALAYATSSTTLLTLSVYAMVFSVGWHYVKQGYGILIVDTVLNRAFFNEPEKKILRANAYACWLYFFLLMNNTLGERDFVGFVYRLYEVPQPLVYIAAGLMLATTLLAAKSFFDATRRNTGRPFPVNGATAYVISLYVWLSVYFMSTAAALAVIPALHSLQYLTVVWRYEKNRNQSIAAASPPPVAPDLAWRKLLRFIIVGIVLGGLAFVAIPFSLDAQLAYDKGVFGAQYVTFMFYIFINIHHYFLDNVMWRKDNPDVGKHLFAAH